MLLSFILTQLCNHIVLRGFKSIAWCTLNYMSVNKHRIFLPSPTHQICPCFEFKSFQTLSEIDCQFHSALKLDAVKNKLFLRRPSEIYSHWVIYQATLLFVTAFSMYLTISFPFPFAVVLTSGDGIALPQKVLFPAERLSLKWNQVHHIGSGLQNLGNTCFLNSALQCLTYTAPLSNYMLSREHSKTCMWVIEPGALLLHFHSRRRLERERK